MQNHKGGFWVSAMCKVKENLNIRVLHVQFAEKFQEVKEAAKLARDKSQEKIETSSNHSQVSSFSVK